MTQMGRLCYNDGTAGGQMNKEDIAMELMWCDVRGLFMRLAPEKQEEFIAYLRLQTDSEGNSEPQPCGSQKDLQNNA